MKYIFTILILMLTLTGIVIAAGNRFVITDENNDFSCSAVFNSKEKKATFLFYNVVADMEYMWNKNNVKDNVMEYGWIVYLEDKHIDIGFNYFKGPFKVRNGSLNDLFVEGQLSIFKHNDSAMDIVGHEPSNLSIKLIDQDVRIDVTIDSVTESYFTDTTGSANFWILEANHPPKKCKTKIANK